MKKLFRWQLRGIYLCVFSFFFAATFFFLSLSFSLPAQEPFRPWIPVGAEVENCDNVHPGTFKVDKTLAAIKEKFEKKTAGPLTIAYVERGWYGGLFRPPFLMYWLADGSGKYYYTEEEVPGVSWRDWLFFSRSAFFNEATGEFRFSFSRYWIFSTIVMAMSFIIGLMFYTAKS
ncbi:MAG: hypothetical protein UT31_C0028G0003 [Parcubacteria group bacterium GW2011_GWF2_39_13b]|nr:MAG: hypothetical protein UT31_C0028G0003 [Parcubacteria group bacterium GW2011_GWF2_39_13b]